MRNPLWMAIKAGCVVFMAALVGAMLSDGWFLMTGICAATGVVVYAIYDNTFPPEE